jgi:hypothetical protein
MKISHTLSPNHKVVKGPHNYSPPGASSGGACLPGAGGGPAGAPGGGMDASGGAAANYSDGGTVTAESGDDAQPTSGYDTGRGSVTPQTGPDAGTKRWKGPTGGEAKHQTADGTYKTPQEIADEQS